MVATDFCADRLDFKKWANDNLTLACVFTLNAVINKDSYTVFTKCGCVHVCAYACVCVYVCACMHVHARVHVCVFILEWIGF